MAGGCVTWWGRRDDERAQLPGKGLQIGLQMEAWVAIAAVAPSSGPKNTAGGRGFESFLALPEPKPSNTADILSYRSFGMMRGGLRRVLSLQKCRQLALLWVLLGTSVRVGCFIAVKLAVS